MTVKNTSSPLCLLAGRRAYAHIQENGLSPSDIKVIAGAAGGPKWLVLHGIDKYLFGDWLADEQHSIDLIGSSIGAWRYAAYCREDFQQAFEAFEKLYFAIEYSDKPDKKEIADGIDEMLDVLFEDSHIDEILSNQHFKLNLFADRCLGLINTNKTAPLISGLLISTLLNFFSRRSLSLFFKRTLFHHPNANAPFMNLSDFPTDNIALSRDNLRQAVLASGSIPIIIEGVKDIPGAAKGLYRDGGMIDYHMSIPYGLDEGIVLLPHFSKTIIPGWLDKFAKIRKPKTEHLDDVLLIAPSDEFIASLPLSKIPDRTDFERFAGDNQARIDYWKEVTKRSEELSDCLADWISSGEISQHIKPFS